MSSNNVFKMVKYFKEEIKKAKVELEIARVDRRELGIYEDCGDFYNENFKMAEEKLNVLVRIKISTEKFAKKLRHQEQGR